MTDSIPAPVRTLEDREIPSPGTWILDPAHTSAQFVARHLMVTKVRGTFHQLEGSIEVGSRPKDSRVEVAIVADSIDTGVEDRDAHLRSPDFLDVESHPTITFVGTEVTPAEEGRWKVAGDLTIRGTTRPVTLEVQFLGVFTDPYGNAKAAFSATTEIDREDWGLSWNVPLEGGGWLVSKKISIEIEAQAALQD